MSSELDRRGFMKASAAGLAAAAVGIGRRAAARDTGAEAEKPSGGKAFEWPFYAFDNGLGTVPTLEGKCKLLKDLGYVGLEYHLSPQLPKMLEQLDKHGLKLNAVYTVPWLEDPVDPKLSDSIKLMKGRDTRIEMGIRSRAYKKPSDTQGDAKGAELLKRVSDLCGETGPVVSVYPHTGFWTERVDDGVRLAKLTERKNVGTNFNLVHWKWVKQSRPLEATLREALPHLFLVTINGLQSNPKGGHDKILPLDEGDYDLVGFMALVRKVGYAGPVGLQCYSVQGPSEVHLKRSMAKWREILGKLANS